MLFLILIYTITLAYLAMTERVKQYLYLLSIQGFILFGIAFLQLKEIHVSHLLFILLETILVKSIAIPLFLNYVRKKNKLQRLDESNFPTFYSVLVITGAIIFSYMLGHYLHEGHLETKFFAVGNASVITGLFFIIAHKNVFTHLIGYLIIENSIFLLALSVGSHQPMLINTTVLLDLFVGVMVLGIFFNRVGDVFQETTVDRLNRLKD